MARLFKTGVTAEGDVSTGGKLQSTNSSGDEGGEIFLNKSATNTTLTGGVTIDVWQNRLRFFEQGGDARGFYIDISAGGTSVGTNLVSGGSYTLPTATATALGGIELFSATTQTTAANAVTTTASRTYGLQLNSDLQGVVNVPWTDTDTNTFPTTWTWTGGTTSGPTASITGTSSTISVASVPVASGSASGVVTTGAQTFAGAKTLSGALTLAAGTTSLSPLTFQSGTNLTTVTAGVKEYDGTVFYQTSDTNPGRALSTQSYYYVSSSDYIIDFTGSGASKSMLGAATRGITVAAGTTYEYELFAAVRHQFAVQSGISGTYQLTNTGGAGVAHVNYVDYGSNTTGFTTATTMSSVRDTGNTLFMAAISSGSRFAILEVKGIIRVTGSGTTKIFPGLSVTAANDNTWTVSPGLIFKMTPVGNGTVTSVGTWA